MRQRVRSLSVRHWRRLVVVMSCAGWMAASGCAHPKTQPAPAPTKSEKAAMSQPSIIPWPTTANVNTSERFQITKDTVVEVSPGQPDLQRIGKWIADLVQPALEASLTVREGSGAPAPNVIRLELSGGGASAPRGSTSPQGDEGYQLTVSSSGIRVVSATPAGAFYGVQTLRQLLPWSIEYHGPRPFDVFVPSAQITDKPRFGWRGAFL